MFSITHVSVTFSNVLFLVFCRFNKCDKKTKCPEMVTCTFKNAIDQLVVFVALAECFSPKIFSTPRSDKFGKRACCVSFSMLVLPRLLAGSRPKKTWAFLPFTAITFRYLRLRNLSWKVLKVIPLKLFYYQTFFETWRNGHSWYEHYKNAIKKWDHRACLRVSGP